METFRNAREIMRRAFLGIGAIFLVGLVVGVVKRFATIGARSTNYDVTQYIQGVIKSHWIFGYVTKFVGNGMLFTILLYLLIVIVYIIATFGVTSLGIRIANVICRTKTNETTNTILMLFIVLLMGVGAIASVKYVKYILLIYSFKIYILHPFALVAWYGFTVVTIIIEFVRHFLNLKETTDENEDTN